METFLINFFKCIIVGIIWAALIIPVFYKRSGPVKYILTVLVIALLCFIFSFWLFSYGSIINTMTVIALISLVISWILSLAVFEKESKVKSKVIAFTCVISGFSYLIATFVAHDLNIL